MMNETINKLTATIRSTWKKNAQITKFRMLFNDTFDRDRRLSVLYITICKYFAICDNTVLLVSHHGKDFFGSPYYIARHLLQTRRYQHLRLIITCPRLAEERLRSSLGSQRLTFCRYNSPAFCFHLARAKYLINDVTFPIYFSRREGQAYLNTWHGTPLKTLGRRVASDVMTNVQNTQRNFLHATHLLAPNKYTEDVLLSDYMIRKIWSGTMVHGGYPRNDAFFESHPRPPQLQPGQYNVVFMPTWRGNFSTVSTASRRQIAALQGLFDLFDQKLDQTITLWVRLHPLIQGKISMINYTRLRDFPEDMEPYQFLAQADALLTDYSSVFFDFAVSGKPILLYTPDLDDYAEERAFGITPETLPFTQLKTPKELIERLSVLAHNPEERKAPPDSFLEQFCAHDQGRNTEELSAQFFFDASALETIAITPDAARKNILFYGGAFLKNGITSSLKNLIDQIDQDQFNIILCVDSMHAEKNAGDYFANLDMNIDFIPIRAFLTVDPIDAIRFLYRYIFAKEWRTYDKFIKNLWKKENRRIFGNAQIDIFVNFDGYSWRAAFMMHGLNAKKIIYIHNDMKNEVDAGKIADRRMLHFAYETADTIVTVREGAESRCCDRHKNFQEKYIFVPNTYSTLCRTLQNEPLHKAFFSGAETLNYPHVAEAMEKHDTFRFVNVARFAVEKGQARLIKAFEQIWYSNEAVQLFIIGGYGPAYQEVVECAEASIANRAIHVVCGSDNPFPLMGKMNAFILSSFYEGLPVVFFEAFALGLPVVSTNIPGPAELLRQGYGLVVDNSEQGLVDGMLAAMNGQVPQRPYDFEAHNRFAMEQFYKAIET